MNDAHVALPHADLLYFADAKWWRWHKERDAYKAFTGQRCTIFITGSSIDDPDVHMLRKFEGDTALSDDPGCIATYSNSGHQALNIAYLTEPRRIILVGYDAMPGDGRRKHFFGDHPDHSAPPYSTMLNGMKAAAKQLKKRGIDVVNVSARSAINDFRRGVLNEELLR